jgi:RNA recognition motif-containing protein
MGRELFVGHISDKAEENDLLKLFAIAGRVVSVHLVTDPETGKFKGCGFVRMASDEETREAILTLDGALLIDRVIVVSEARPQKAKVGDPRGYKAKAGRGSYSRKARKKD